MTFFSGFEVSALSLYAAWCLIFASLNGLTDPDYIVQEASEIEDVLYLRKNNQLSADALAASHIEINIGNGFTKTLGDYLTLQEIQSNLVKFVYTEETSISEVLKQYDENYTIITAIENKLNKSSNYDEYEVWRIMREANMISKNIAGLFDGHILYSGYIREHDPILWKYIEPFLTNREPGYKKFLKELYGNVQEAYRDYISSVTDGQIILATDEKDLGGGENIEEIGILFNEFMSYYTKILRQDFNVIQDDPTNNAVFFLYAKVIENIITEYSDGIALVEDLISDHFYDKRDFDILELLHFFTDNAISYDNIYLELLYENKYIGRSTYSILFELTYKKFKEFSVTTNSDSIGLEEAVYFS